MRRRIFVFGSNMLGIHGAGAALYAERHYGAVDGVGEGLTGDAYALPTKRTPKVALSFDMLNGSIQRFVAFAAAHPEMDFLLTAVGCGLAGWHTDVVWRMFPQMTDNVYVQARLCQEKD